ncbi:MAG: Rieske (2Fe-2S) protein [Chloroherpetonaceae bacterium]|nr:Rieske (2Fe-2S) protein [Chloroherpetonaceae bacterium]
MSETNQQNSLKAKATEVSPEMISLDESELISRRAFAKLVFTGMGICYAGALGYPVYRYLATPIEKAKHETAVTEVTLGEAAKIEQGSALMFKFGTKPAMIIHHTDGTWSATEAVCTHLGCTVQYQSDKEQLFCACHNGTYDAKTGKNTGGPPPKPLKSLAVSNENGVITVKKV